MEVRAERRKPCHVGHAIVVVVAIGSVPLGSEWESEHVQRTARHFNRCVGQRGLGNVRIWMTRAMLFKDFRQELPPSEKSLSPNPNVILHELAAGRYRDDLT